jgi:hypothetical protein
MKKASYEASRAALAGYIGAVLFLSAACSQGVGSAPGAGAFVGSGTARMSAAEALKARPAPSAPPAAFADAVAGAVAAGTLPFADVAPGYCASSGGSTLYENISGVTITPQPDGQFVLSVDVNIANPTGCTSGNPCPEYDNSPEYVNAWIDWNRDGAWQASERVMDEAMTGYLSINYRGTMTAKTVFTPPASLPQDPTWLRANLGWATDPNDPCTPSWTWGNVYDAEQIFPRPKVESVAVSGVGTPSSEPQTDQIVEIVATIDVPADYALTDCAWTGQLTPGSGLIDPVPGTTKSTCTYDYLPATGVGPDDATYGPKAVTLTVSYQHVPSGATGQVSFDHSYRVFFAKAGDDDGDLRPNWFEYWGVNGAVAGLTRPDVIFDTTLGAGTYGAYFPSTDLIQLGPAAAEVHYPTTINVPAVPGSCPGGTFGGAQGIDTASEVIGHEGRHKVIYHNWDPGGIWNGLTDSDDPDAPTKHDFPADDLPDTYEAVAGTDPFTIDSCDLATYKAPVYAQYGDNEFDALVAGNGLEGVAANDWANPGKQTAIPFDTTALAAMLDGTLVTSSGTAQPLDIAAPRLADTATLGQIVGNYADAGRDLDGDGLFDKLEVSLDVQIAVADQYNVVVWLADASGTNFVWASASGPFAVGTKRVAVLFDGTLVRRAATDGPYTVSLVELRAGPEELLADSRANVYQTAPYLRTAFDPPAAAFDGTYAETTADTDADGMYNRLQIGVGVAVHVPGKYTVTGELATPSGKSIAVSRVTPTLSAGSQVVNLVFDGRSVFQRSENGPYTLRSLRVESGTTRYDYVASAYATAAYAYQSFQHTGTTFLRDGYAVQGLDVDQDGLLDYLRVTLRVGSNQPGTYRLSATLQDGKSSAIDVQARDVILASGTTSLAVDFPGGEIRKHGVNGPYVVGPISLLTKTGALADAQPVATVTPAWAANAFGPAPVLLSGTYGDAGDDMNGDGRYEALDVSVGVVPGIDGVVRGRGRLVDATGAEIGWAEGFVSVTKGTPATLVIPFPGELLFTSGKDGPYRLASLLVYHTIDPEQSVYATDVHTTGPYNHRQFRPQNATDLIAPTTTATVTPPANAAGWSTTPVTVALTAVDDPQGAGVQEIVYQATGAQPLALTTVFASAVTLPPFTAEGVTTITYFAADRAGNLEAPKTLEVRVDLTPPKVSCAVTPPVLGPPNHKLVPVRATVTVTDSGSGPAGFVLTSVKSSEPDNGLGDGDTAGDIQGFVTGTADVLGSLRAERAGVGPGRTYTLSYRATDVAGNAATCDLKVQVPHDAAQ